MILGTKARYAVMAMVDLGASVSDKPVTLADIAERQEIPLPYLEQIFAKLRRSGVIKSVKGPGGGYLLAQEATDIRISDIVSAVDESIKMTRCDAHAEGGCMAPRTKCLTHDLWDGLGNQIFKYLHSISLADVCDRKLKKQSLAMFSEFPGVQEQLSDRVKL